ncbi:MAG: asparagine synthase (glutamine-hydrolyzing) [Planctomycetaceae bacterium]
MCGICGIIATNPGLIEASVDRMMRVMHHRGPDDGGFELLPLGPETSGPFAGLGFRRLAILDLSPAGHQPMVNPDTGDCLVFNGEIYNFRDLRADLAATGASFRSTGDTEVLLQALSTWREAALEKIQGMYALAFYHAATRRILLARDPLGIKPLYAGHTASGFVFASEVRAVRAAGLLSDELDVSGIAGMLAYGAVQSPRTVFSAIRSFPPGAFQWIDGGVATGRPPATPRRFWRFGSRPRPPQDHAAVVADVNRLLHDAVSRHLAADVPVGVFLSAGIDSTVVAAFAREYSPAVAAYTVGFDAEHGEDEVAIAAQSAASLGIRHTTVTLDTQTVRDRWPKWLASLDSPSVDGFNTYIISEWIRSSGAIVALSGLGADELFGGYVTFAPVPRLVAMLRAVRFVPPPLRAAVVATLGSVRGRPGAYDKLADLVAGDPSVAGVMRSLRRVIASRSLCAMRLEAVRLGLRPDYLDPASPFLADPPLADVFNEISRTESTHYMGDTLLRDTDANSMRHSLEVRVPFLDLPLVDYLTSLPGSVKRPAGAPTKVLLREAGRSVLSDAVTNRAKTGFMLPIGAWMRREMRDSCAAAVEHVAGLPFVDGTSVRRVWQTFLESDRALHWSRPLAIVSLGTYLLEARRHES